MAKSTEILHVLKKATNYSKLAMHKEGPRSFKEGQGALIKVLFKFSDDNTMTLKQLKKALHWRTHELVHVAEKAEDNGYISYAVDGEGKLSLTLTDKGAEVIQKRLAAEDRAADSVLDGLTDAEREQLVAISEKIISNCEAMGVDYSDIYKKKCRHGRDKARCHGHNGQRGTEPMREDFDESDDDALEVVEMDIEGVEE